MKSKMIFIAYQDDLQARSLSTYFHGLGYRVEIARLVSDIIRKIRSGKIHVILLDDEIEGVKACDLVPIFKKIDPRIQVIVISSEGVHLSTGKASERHRNLLPGDETG